MKGQKFFYFVELLLEVAIIVVIMEITTFSLEVIAEDRFGVSIPNTDPSSMTLIWIVSYVGIIVMLHKHFPYREDNLFISMAIAIVGLVKGSNILFAGILPAIDWGKTGDLLVFLGGLSLLAVPILLIFFYDQIHKLFFLDLDPEDNTREEKKEI